MFNAINAELRAEVLDQLPIPVYKCDREGYITSYNQAALELWGKEPESGVKYGGAWRVFDADGQPMMPENYPTARTLAGKTPIKGEQVIIERRDGSQRRVQSHPVPIFDENGELTGAINTLVDITEAIQAEEKQARLAAIVDTSDDAIISKTLQGIITSWNKAAEKMFGYAEQEAIGHHISLIIPQERKTEEDYIIGKIISGQKVDHFETIRITKNGTSIPLSITVSPVINNSGVIIGASKIARDISERKKAEEQKNDFLSLASHELKTPLTSMSGYMQILDKMFDDEKSQKFIGKTRQQINRLTQLVSDLLDVSKIDADRLHISKEIFDINKVLLDAVEFIQNSQPSHLIKANIPDRPAFIYGNAQRIEQVFINLFANAIKYSPDAHEIVVSEENVNNQVLISIRDFGIGIPADKIREIFTRFYKVDESARSMPGLGIGLYISSRIIEKHNGKLWAESEPGKGSTFCIALPSVVPQITLDYTTIDKN
ncbi:MAG TPA: PAS domain S-box protein [Mucilaginibacter sp.]|jgi:PAS domain S-box-containing protein|nr:PAS domain S-box protein [Mucilaginibacter sp.]